MNRLKFLDRDCLDDQGESQLESLLPLLRSCLLIPMKSLQLASTSESVYKTRFGAVHHAATHSRHICGIVFSPVPYCSRSIYLQGRRAESISCHESCIIPHLVRVPTQLSSIHHLTGNTIKKCATHAHPGSTYNQCSLLSLKPGKHNASTLPLWDRYPHARQCCPWPLNHRRCQAECEPLDEFGAVGSSYTINDCIDNGKGFRFRVRGLSPRFYIDAWFQCSPPLLTRPFDCIRDEALSLHTASSSKVLHTQRQAP